MPCIHSIGVTGAFSPREHLKSFTERYEQSSCRSRSPRKWHSCFSALVERTTAKRCTRRDSLLAAYSACVLTHLVARPCEAVAKSGKYEEMEALKGKDYGKARQRYSDYVLTDSGLQYQDIREGTGAHPDKGSKVAVQWDGYTIGYYGRPFEARNKAKGGSFSGVQEQDLFRFELGANKAIPAFEEAVTSMKQGGIRRIVVPVELGYPDNDFNKRGPKPSSFSGQRALDFVLKNNGLIDKTLLFDIELVRIS